jgi:hypothetical protein
MTKALIRILSIIVVVASFTSCVKKDNYFSYDTSTPNRKQTIKIANASDIVTIARDVNPMIDTFEVIDLRRAPNDNAQLNQPLTVKLVKNPTLISDYNTANGTSFVELPAAAYKLLTDITNVTFAAGQDIIEIKIRLDKSQLDLSQQYALGFSLSDGGTATIETSSKNGLYSIGVKNKWDGVYAITGTFLDITNANFTGSYPLEWELQTSGASQCIVVDNVYLGIPGHVFLNSGSLTYYGSFGLVVNFDPATDQISSIVNYYGQPAGNTRSAVLDPSGLNKYDGATKTINIKYFMKQPSVVPAAPNIRTYFDETWKFEHAR